MPSKCQQVQEVITIAEQITAALEQCERTKRFNCKLVDEFQKKAEDCESNLEIPILVRSGVAAVLKPLEELTSGPITARSLGSAARNLKEASTGLKQIMRASDIGTPTMKRFEIQIDSGSFSLDRAEVLMEWHNKRTTKISSPTFTETGILMEESLYHLSGNRWLNTWRLEGFLSTKGEWYTAERAAHWLLERDLDLPFQLAGRPRRRKGMSKEEANKTAMRLANKDKKAFFLLSKREQARRIGCSYETWTNTDFYKKAERMRSRALKKRPASPPVVSLTKPMEATIGSEDPSETLKELIDDQNDDREPSPLEKDPLSERPRKLRSRKRL